MEPLSDTKCNVQVDSIKHVVEGGENVDENINEF